VLYYHTDQLGSVRAITDSSGSVVEQYSYDPYGNVNASGVLSQVFQFAGQYTDTESGLYYLRARFYDPIVGQLLGRDPLVASTREPYVYAGNNPLNSVDPSGEDGTASGSRTSSGSNNSNPMQIVNDVVSTALEFCDSVGKQIA